MHNTLYLKYRPQDFDSTCGQRHIKQTLKNAAKQGKISHAYLFAGPRGTGKTSIARIVAKALNCTDLKEDGNPCNKCSICTQITEGRLVDIIEIDAASNRGIDEIRAIKERIEFSPNIAKYKVYIIDEVHMLSKDASNALLKTLEEPPNHVYFILATTEANKILPTIISRCQYFQFQPISVEDISERLAYVCNEEKVNFEKEGLNLIAEIAQGGMRDALSILESLISQNGNITSELVKDTLGLGNEDFFELILNIIIEKDIKRALDELSEISKIGLSVEQFAKGFQKYIRKLMIKEAVTKNQKTDELVLYITIIEQFDKAISELKYSHHPILPIELALIKIILDISDNDTNIDLKFSNDQKTQTGERSMPGDNGHCRVQKGERKATEAQEVESKTKEEQEDEREKKESPLEAQRKKTEIVETQNFASKEEPEIKGEKVEESKEEINPVSNTNTDSKINITMIKKDWEDICNKIPKILLRIAFKDHGKPCSIENGLLKIMFYDEFNYKKANTHESIGILETILSEKFGEKIEVLINFSKNEEEKKKNNEEKIGNKTQTPKANNYEDNDLDKIANFFGGKIL